MESGHSIAPWESTSPLLTCLLGKLNQVPTKHQNYLIMSENQMLNSALRSPCEVNGMLAIRSDGNRLQPKLRKFEKSHTDCTLTSYQMFFLPTLQLDGRAWVLQSGSLRTDFSASVQIYLSVTTFSDMLSSFRESQWGCWAAQQFVNSNCFLGNEPQTWGSNLGPHPWPWSSCPTAWHYVCSF